jgi:hypothetical protein
VTPDQDAQAAVKKLLMEQPTLVLFGGIALYALMGRGAGKPAWTKDLPPVGGPVAGAWRGKGSFGHGFGSQVKHR